MKNFEQRLLKVERQPMKRPIIVTILSILFILIGIANTAKAVWPLLGGSGAHITGHELMDSSFVFVSAVLAFLGGVLMLRGANAGRWLVLIWMGLHVVLSIFHRPVELAIHSLMFVILIALLLFGSSGRYFKRAA
jgi:hypothetical protein